jgi:hypothetical protein
MPAWLVFSGVTIGIVGASVTKHAESVGELVGALDSWADTSDLAAVAPAEWAWSAYRRVVKALSGLVTAARRPNLSVIEPLTATSLESAISRGRELRQNALTFGPACNPRRGLARAGSVGGVRGTGDHHAAQADPARQDRSLRSSRERVSFHGRQDGRPASPIPRPIR